MVIGGGGKDPAPQTQVFVVRLWPEDVGGGRTDWRGRVQHVTSGEARYFRDWATLEAFLEKLLRRVDPEGPGADGIEETK